MYLNKDYDIKTVFMLFNDAQLNADGTMPDIKVAIKNEDSG